MNKITLTITNSSVFVDGMSKQVYNLFKSTIGYKPDNADFMIQSVKAQKPWMAQWDGVISLVCNGPRWCKCSIRKQGIHFPTGLLSMARNFFTQNGMQYELVDARVKPVKKYDFGMSEKAQSRDYQDRFVASALRQRRGIGVACTGAGKTACGARIFKQLGVQSIFFVPSVDLMTQTKQSFQNFLLWNGIPMKVGSVGGGEFDLQPITVMTIQTAIRSVGQKFVKANDQVVVQQDSEQVIAKYPLIKQFIHTAQAVVFDECISGDSILYTKDGQVKIKDAKNLIGKELLSFSGIDIVWKKMTHYYPKGTRQTITISLNNGESIKCTKNHPIMTQSGWKQAGQISQKDRILCFVNAAAEREQFSKNKGAQVIGQNIYQDIKLEKEHNRNGKRSISQYQKTLLYAYADAVKEQAQNILHQNCLLKTKEVKNITNISQDIVKGAQHLASHCISKNAKQYQVLYQEMGLQGIQEQVVQPQDLGHNIALNKNSGHCINAQYSTGFYHSPGSISTQDLEMESTWQYRSIQHQQTALNRQITQSRLMERKEFQDSGQTLLAKLAQLGGFVMTGAHAQEGACTFIHRDSQNSRYRQPVSGFARNTEKQQSINIKTNSTTAYLYQNRQDRMSINQSSSMSPSACDINFVGISSIVESGQQQVFDITIQDTHCFFSNSMLVHNCQFCAAQTAQVLSDNCINAYYKWGLSATPFRDMNDDILIESCFGRIFQKITASQLIQKGFLVQPKIYMVPVKNMYGKTQGHTYHEIYKQAIVNNPVRNEYIVNIAKQMQKQGKQTLILVKNVQHGKLIQSLIQGCVFLHGGTSKKKRKQHLQKMRKRQVTVTCATVIFDVGVDVKPLDVLISAGSGKSITRALQRVGRVIRPYQDKSIGYKKQQAIVIDFMDHCRYLLAHSKKRKKMYQSQPKFIVQDLKLE